MPAAAPMSSSKGALLRKHKISHGANTSFFFVRERKLISLGSHFVTSLQRWSGFFLCSDWRTVGFGRFSCDEIAVSVIVLGCSCFGRCCVAERNCYSTRAKCDERGGGILMNEFQHFDMKYSYVTKLNAPRGVVYEIIKLNRLQRPQKPYLAFWWIKRCWLGIICIIIGSLFDVGDAMHTQIFYSLFHEIALHIEVWS